VSAAMLDEMDLRNEYYMRQIKEYEKKKSDTRVIVFSSVIRHITLPSPSCWYRDKSHCEFPSRETDADHFGRPSTGKQFTMAISGVRSREYDRRR